MKGIGPAAATAALGAAALTEAVSFDRAPVVTIVSVAVVAPLALVRLWPAIAAVLSALAAVTGLLSSIPITWAGVIALAVLYGVAGRRHPLSTAAALILPFAVYLPLPMTAVRPGGKTVAAVLLAVASAAVAIGAALRLRDERRRLRATEQSAAASLMEYAARGERARIARELHDVVAHHITMIALQAEAARLATPGLPPEGARRLTAIGDTARTALTEMRRLLGVLREDGEAEPVALQPQPGLRQLTTLLDEVRDAAAGTGVRLIVSGAVGPLDPGIELTAYRIVQEALTNSRRHAPGAAVDVELHYSGDDLVVRVYDNGPGPADTESSTGLGLAGMQERAAMVGGTVKAGPAPGAGFLVEAVLPVKGIGS